MRTTQGSKPKYSPFKNGDTVSAADVVGNVGSIALVVHQKDVNIPDVANKELFEAIRKKVASLRAMVKMRTV